MTSSQKIRICCALAVAIAAGCGNGQEPPAPVGTLSMALTTTNGATTYRLVGATFEVTGAESATLSPGPEQERLTMDFSAGDYNIALQTGWHMESSVDGGPFAAVNAVLESPASQAFSIFDQEVTYVRYRFRAGPDVMELGDGRLSLEIEVDDGSSAACAVAPAACGQSTVTCTGHTATIEDTCLFSTGPDGTTITCSGTGTTIPSGFGVAPNGYGNAARQLADLQDRLLAYFESHGAFPIATAANTPAATCCAPGGVFECPPNPSVWESMGPWDVLGFSIDAPHSFVFSYSAATGDTAEVIATGDLDCDSIGIEYVLSCSATNGTPSCTLSLPVACVGADYD